MQAEVLFYKTKHTEINRPLLEAFFARYGISLNKISGAASPEQLARRLGEALPRCQVAAVVGGLGLEGEQNVRKVLSIALHLPLLSKPGDSLINAMLGGAAALGTSPTQGEALCKGQQALLLLPDPPEALEKALAPAGCYLEKQLGASPLPEKQAGRGVVFAQDDPEDVRAVLEPPAARKKGALRRRLLVAGLSLLALLLFGFLVYWIYLRPEAGR